MGGDDEAIAAARPGAGVVHADAGGAADLALRRWPPRLEPEIGAEERGAVQGAIDLEGAAEPVRGRWPDARPPAARWRESERQPGSPRRR